jgi:hypothetical protein
VNYLSHKACYDPTWGILSVFMEKLGVLRLSDEEVNSFLRRYIRFFFGVVKSGYCGINMCLSGKVNLKKHRADGFGGLVVRMLASGSRVRGFNPG